MKKANRGAAGLVVATVLSGIIAMGPLPAFAETSTNATVEEQGLSDISYIPVVDQPVTLPPFTTHISDIPSVTTVPSIDTVDYPDVIKGEWYVDGIHFCKIHRIITGYANGYFGVNDPITRAQFVTIIWRIAQPSAASSYIQTSATNTTGIADVQGGQYYTGAVNWAVKNGVISGYRSPLGIVSFGAEDPLTTEQLCVILARYTGNDHGNDESVLNKFSDSGSISDYARNSVAWACNKGLVTGYPMANGRREIRPQEHISRARVATIIQRAAEKGILSIR